MLPILTGVVLRGQPGGLRSLVLSLVYVLPMGFAILGALMGLFGAELNLQARLQSPWVLVPFAIFLALFGAASLGFLNCLPAAIDGPLQRSEPTPARRHGIQRSGPRRAFQRTGFTLRLSTIGPARCCISAPARRLVAAPSYWSWAWAWVRHWCCSPSAAARLLPKSGTWMITVRNLFGALLMAVAIWLLERVLPGPISLAL